MNCSGLTKGWDAVVGTDNQMRMWYPDDPTLGGLLFNCWLGQVDLDAPVGAPRVQACVCTILTYMAF